MQNLWKRAKAILNQAEGAGEGSTLPLVHPDGSHFVSVEEKRDALLPSLLPGVQPTAAPATEGGEEDSSALTMTMLRELRVPRIHKSVPHLMCAAAVRQRPLSSYTPQ